ncbi:MAG: MATE family efflux transporter, partial [Cyanobacteria bacterium P01_H01_bin.121]
ICTNIVISLLLSGSTLMFPQKVLGLLTNHSEVVQAAGNYLIWLLPFVIFSSLSLILEGYFIGIQDGKAIRNSCLISFVVGMLPLAFIAMYYRNNHLIWASYTVYMMLVTVLLVIHISNKPATLEPQTQLP